MAAVLAILYLVGVLVAAGVSRSRVGISQRGRLSVGTIVTSMPWFLTQMAMVAFWPIFLCVWLARGRPASPWKSVATTDGSIRVRRRSAS